MSTGVVFYFDVLGFRQMSAGTGKRARDSLTSLAELLGDGGLRKFGGRWSGRFALSYSVFLTHADPVTAFKSAQAFFFNLMALSAEKKRPLLIRGALAHGTFRRPAGVLGTPNIVGQAVVDAVALEEGSHITGPRLLLNDALARRLIRADHRVKWQLRPTPCRGVWETLWILPPDPDQIDDLRARIKDVCQHAVKLAARYGGNETYGGHYRQYVLLAARSVGRIARLEPRLGGAVAEMLRPRDVRRLCDSVSGLPEVFVLQLRTWASEMDERLARRTPHGVH